MPGIRITDRQVHLYMSYRKHNTQELAAAKAGMNARTARRIEGKGTLPSQQPRRYWRSRPDPFAAVWETEIVPLLQNAPRLMAITLLRQMQEQHPGYFPDGVLCQSALKVDPLSARNFDPGCSACLIRAQGILGGV